MTEQKQVTKQNTNQLSPWRPDNFVTVISAEWLINFKWKMTIWNDAISKLLRLWLMLERHIVDNVSTKT